MIRPWAAAELDVKIAFTIFYATLAWQVWRKRYVLGRISAAAHEFAKPKPTHMKDAAAGAAGVDDETWVQEHLDELRVLGMSVLAKVGTGVYSLGIAVLSMTWGDMVESLGQFSSRAILLIIILTWACYGSVALGHVKLNPHRVRCVLVTLNVLVMMRMSFPCASGSSRWQSVGITPLRAWSTAIFLDARSGAVLNIVWYAAILCQYGLKSQFSQQEDDSIAITETTAELIGDTAMSLNLVLWGKLVQEIALYFLRLSLGELSTKAAQRAMLKVLGVLFDADVLLDSFLKIDGPTAKLASVLAPDEGTDGAAALEGRDITDFVAPCDLERFKGLLSSSIEAGVEGLPARSMQLQLRDAGGQEFPAEVIHVQFARAAGGDLPRKHLLGIRECSSTRREASPPKGPCGQEFGPGAPSLGGEHGADRRGPPGAGTIPEPTIDTSITLEYSLLPSPIERMEFRVEVASRPLMKMKELRVTFRTDFPASQQPSLMDWLPEGQCEEFRVWVESTMNERIHGLEEAPFGSLKVKWPSPSPAQDSMVLLEAGSVALDYPGTDGAATALQAAAQPEQQISPQEGAEENGAMTKGEEGEEQQQEGRLLNEEEEEQEQEEEEEEEQEEEDDEDDEESDDYADEDEEETEDGGEQQPRAIQTEVVLTLDRIRRVRQAMARPEPDRQQRPPTHQTAGHGSNPGEPQRPTAHTLQ